MTTTPQAQTHSPRVNDVFTPGRYDTALLALVALVSVYRALVLLGLIDHGLNLYSDEAYYWGWAQHFQFGYYSKPPMVAWVIMATTGVCGDGEFCVKLGSLLLYPFTTWFLFLIGRRLFDERIGFYAALVFFLMPAVSVSALIISTDVMLFLFWCMALYFFIRALDTNHYLDWGFMGVALGLGLLSKYTMAAFLLSAFVYLLASERHRRQLLNPRLYLSIVVGLVVFSPNLVWNYQHRFASFTHTAEISQLDQDLFHPERLAAFVVSQFGFFGPILMGVFVYASLRFRRLIGDDRFLLLMSFSWALLAIMLVQGTLAGANTNWAAPVYASASVMTVAYLLRAQRTRLLAAAIGVNLVIGVALYHYYTFTDLIGVELTRKTDPFSRNIGWHALGGQVQEVLARHPGAQLLGDNRNLLAELIYYIDPHPFDAAVWNPTGQVTDHYRLTADARHRPGASFVYVTVVAEPKGLEKSFRSVRYLGKIEVPLYRDYTRVYHAHYLEQFTGY